MSTNKKGGETKRKVAKAEKAELDRILKEIDKESKALETPGSQSKSIADCGFVCCYSNYIFVISSK